MAVLQTDKVLSFGDLVSDVGTVQLYPLGTKREQDGETYRYVTVNDATVALASGLLVYRGVTASSAKFWEIVSDVSDTASGCAAGVAISVIANAGYGWIKTKGYVSNLKKTTGAGQAWVKGQVLYAGNLATDDGRAVAIALAATTKVSGAEIRKFLQRIVGFAAAAVSTTTATGGCFIDLE